ncbi:RNA-directed DNA polymerase, eukaryota, reverse transcriptase zinc-binding domain protein [Tanacetum coccineum]
MGTRRSKEDDWTEVTRKNRGYRSKEDDLVKVHSNADLTRTISKSIFVTNFPDNTTSADLWNICQTYGVVVDVYIPNRRSKVGKRFAFVRFIKVTNVERLVGNLCTLWIGRMHLHANVVRFERTPFQQSQPPPPTRLPSNLFIKKIRIDPFNIYDILNKENKDVNAAATNSSIPFPPGFTPDKPDTDVDELVAQKDQKHTEKKKVFLFGDLEEMISVGQNRCFSMEGLGSKAKKDWIRELCNKNKVSFLSIQETKAEKVSDMEIKSLWGNTNFDAIVSQSLVSVYAPQAVSLNVPLVLFILSYKSLEWRVHVSRGNLTGIMHTLRCFSLLSGLSINLKKSQLLGVGIPESQVLEAATLIGCSVLHTPFKYLGIMVGENMSSIRAWDETVNKLKMSLSSWKLKTLSIGGRLTLLKSVLGSTPIYNMSLFKVPKAVLKSMESIRRNFFNGIRDGEKKIAWVSWSKVLASKSNGGLGVSSFYALNRGLLFKWIWRFLSRDQSLWAQVIHALHGSNTSTLSASYSSLWSSIIKECNALKSQGLDLISHCKIRVGNGMSTSFWHDQWLGDSCLRLSYPRLFALENNKVCSVAAKMSAPFVSSLRRDVRGGEESAQLSRISDLLDTVVLSNMGDRRFWDLNGDGCFRVKDVRRLLDDMLLPKSDVPSRWVKQIPIKVNVLAWKISMDRLPSRVNLHQRGVQVSLISCPICCEALENLDHLLFCYRVSRSFAVCCGLTGEGKSYARSICIGGGLVWNPVDSFDLGYFGLIWFSFIQGSKQGAGGGKVEGVCLGECFTLPGWSIWSYRYHLSFSDSNLRKVVFLKTIGLGVLFFGIC